VEEAYDVLDSEPELGGWLEEDDDLAQEVHRRCEELRSGKVKGLTREQVFEPLKKRYAKKDTKNS